ncbi:Transient receptor potential channel pyrexia, partial [Orchesella cincta]
MLYENCPLAVKALMDRSFSEDKRALMDNEMEDALLVDYGSITGYMDPVSSCRQQETKYLFESLSWKYETQKEILLHPLTQVFVIKKWRRLSPIITFWIVWQFIWLLSYTILVLSAYRSGHTSSSGVVAVIAATLMSIYVLASFLNESFEIYGLGLRYFKSVTNSFQIVQNVLAIIAVAPIFLTSEPEKWQKYTTAVGPTYI